VRALQTSAIKRRNHTDLSQHVYTELLQVVSTIQYSMLPTFSIDIIREADTVGANYGAENNG
jgi:hypothetical protein